MVMKASLPSNALPVARGRGVGLNPANRFESLRLEVLPEAVEAAVREHPEGVRARTVIHPDNSRRVINRVKSPDLSFEWTLNPYRGCEHSKLGSCRDVGMSVFVHKVGIAAVSNAERFGKSVQEEGGMPPPACERRQS